LNSNTSFLENNVGRGDLLMSKVKPGGEWDYKRQDRQFFYNGELITGEEYGNIHYGYVGTAAGFGADILKDVAGLVQVHKDTAQWGDWRTNFDDPRDTQNIQRGINDYMGTHNNASTRAAKRTNVVYKYTPFQKTFRSVTTEYMGGRSLYWWIR
jgi:hypothetical protein